MSSFAGFTAAGDCVAIVQAAISPEPDGLLWAGVPSRCGDPSRLWRDMATGEVRERLDHSIDLPAMIPVDTDFPVSVPDGCRLFVNGAESPATLNFSLPGPAMIELRGPLRYEGRHQIVTYREARAAAYPSIPDQLDLLYHGGLEAWGAAILAVKSQFPKA